MFKSEVDFSVYVNTRYKFVEVKMVSQKNSNVGYLEFYRKDGKPTAAYELKVGSNKIGTSLLADIRLKSKNQYFEPFVCIINVKKNGLATVEKTCKEILLLNGSKMNKIHILKNNDQIDIAGKVFRYINNKLSLPEFPESIKTEKRQSINPNFKIGAGLQIPVSVRNSSLKQSFPAVKNKKDILTKSCLSALASKRRRSLFEWKTVTISNFRRSLRPSTSMKKNDDLSIIIRKVLFLKYKDVCFANSNYEKKSLQSTTSLLSLNDSQSSTFLKTEISSSPRGLKRRHDSSSDSFSKLNKRQKNSKDDLVQPVPYRESFSADSSSSLENICQNSPLMTTTELQETSLNDGTNVKSAKKNWRTSLNDLNGISDVKGTKKSLRILKLQKFPRNDLIQIERVKKNMKSSNSQQSDVTPIQGIKKIIKSSKGQKSTLNDLSDVQSVKKFMKTPRIRKSPVNDLMNSRAVRDVFKTPKLQISPANDLRDVSGVKKLMRTPKKQKSPLNNLTNVAGVKKLMGTPKLQKSPINDLTNVDGVKKLFKSPKIQKSPVNNLSDVRGVKKIFKTPKIQKSPLNDLSNICEIKNILKTPKPQTILNDFKGLKRIFGTPKIQKSPANSLTDLKGVKKLLASPKIQRSPKNDLSNLEGVKELFSPKRTFNDTLEPMYEKLVNDSAVHNSIQESENSKSGTCTSPKNQTEEGIQLSQRGRRIRLKRFDDNFIESPRPKSRSSKCDKRNGSQKTVDLSGKASVSDDAVEKSNLKEEVLKMPLRNLRSRRKNAVEEIDGLNSSVYNARGSKRKNNEEANVDDILNTYKVATGLVTRRGRKKNPVEEVTQRTASPNIMEKEICDDQSKTVTREGHVRNLNFDGETPKTRNKRKQNLDTIHIDNTNTEIKLEKKRKVGDRKKIEESDNEYNEGGNKKVTRSRKRKNTVGEVKNETIIAAPEKSRKNVCVETELGLPEVTITRSRRKVIEDKTDIPEEEKKSRRNKRKNIEVSANENDESIEGKKTSKVANCTDNKDVGEVTKGEKISPMKTRRVRKASTQIEVKQTRRRRK